MKPEKSAKPRVLVTTSTFPRWKGDTDPPFVKHLCEGLSKHFEIHVLAPHAADTSTFEILDDVHVFRYRYAPQGLEVLAYDGGMLRRIKKSPLTALLLPCFLFFQWLSIIRLNRKYAYGAIHAHWIIPQGIVAAFTGIKYLLTSHGGDLYALNSPLLSWLKKISIKRAEAVTVVSHAMTTECARLGLAAERISVQPMGVDTRNLFRPPEQKNESLRKDVLFVGRLVEKKGLNILLKAISILAVKGVDVRLTVIGDGPDRSALEQQSASLQIDKLVQFEGAKKQDDLIHYYQRAMLFALPSIVSQDGDQEGLGLVTVEAMACGCTVIASDLPAVRDVVTDNTDGRLVEPGSPSALADVILELWDDQKRRERLAKAAISSARRFDWANVSAQYAKKLDEIMELPQH